MYRNIIIASDGDDDFSALDFAIGLADADAHIVLIRTRAELADHLRDMAESSGADLLVLDERLRETAPAEHPVVGQLAQDAPCAVAVATRVTGAPRLGVAYDGSPEADVALAAARAIARETGARLVLLAVAELPHDDVSSWRVLTEAAADAGADLRFVRGLPGPAIAAASGDLSMLVCGSRRIGEPGRLLAGSVGAYLLTHSPVPVIVTPRSQPRTDDARFFMRGDARRATPA